MYIGTAALLFMLLATPGGTRPIADAGLATPGNGIDTWTPPSIVQAGSITGLVVEARTRRPLAGVQVHIPGSGIGAATSAAGRFLLTDVPDGEVLLRVEIIGYRSTEQRVTIRDGETTTVNFALEEQALGLEQIIVTGTAGGTQRKAIGNVVERIAAARIAETAPATDVQQLLGQRTAGVIIRPSAGMVGGGSGINIRGASSLSLSNHPLIFIDGVRVDNNPNAGPNIRQGRQVSRLNDINPEDIESIEVIKGPAASTLYGTEASNGVIQIITKKGTVGAPTLEVVVRQGASWMPNPEGRLPYTYYYNPTTGVTDSLNVYLVEKQAGRDIFQNGRLQTYSVAVRGGTDLVRYYVSADVDDHEGIVSYNWLKRLNSRATLSLVPSDKWDVNVSVGVLRSQTRLAQSISGYDLWATLVWAKPDLLSTPTRGFRYLPPEEAAKVESYLDYDRHIGSLQVNHQPFRWLTHRMTLGLDWGHELNTILVPRVPEGEVNFFGAVGSGQKDAENRINVYSSMDYGATATFRLQPQLASATSVGLQYYHKELTLTRALGNQFPVPAVTTVGGASVTTGSEDFIENKTLGTFIQQQLDWRGIVFLTGAVRADDNSAFGSEFDLAIYPKASATWVISDESFWNIEPVNTLRLRTAWGQAGQQPDVFDAVTLYTPTTGPGGQPMLTPGSLGTPTLKPEKGEELEVGFDAGFLDDRITLAATYYTRITKDAIASAPVRPSFGFPGSQVVNIGRVKNWGTELGLNATVLRRPTLAWNLGVTYATHENRIESMGGLPPSGSNREGYPLNSVFAHRVVSASMTPTNVVFDAMCDGGPANNHQPMPCDEAPEVFFGTANPKWSGNVITELQIFRNLRLVANADFQGGHVYGSGDIDAGHTTFSNTRAVNPIQDPILQAYRTIVNRTPSGLYDAAFWKLRELSATYNIPSGLLGGFGVSRASITGAWRNVAVLWQGQKEVYGSKIFEVEVNAPGDSPSARWQTVLPQNSQFVSTLRVTF